MGQTIVLGVSGGIAAYKSAALCSLLVKSGYDVRVLMTKNATNFIQPLTFQALSKHPVVVDTFDEPNPSEIAHIAIADSASLFLVAPATANIIAKLAHGIADDMVTTTALAVQCPTVVAPAMNVHMYGHPAVQANLDVLRGRGVVVMDPGSGPLACGYTGKGRMPEPDDVLFVVDAVLSKTATLAGARIVVTAGPTIEDIDPIRFLSNSSSGKMGYEIAREAVARGAEVTLVSGPTHLAPVPGARMRYIRSTQDLLAAVTEAMASATVLIAAAAPADFRPSHRLPHKWKKSQGVPSVELVPTPDVLSTVAKSRAPGMILVGFAAETANVVEGARRKLEEKDLDLVVANNILDEGAGFAVDTNRVTFVRRNREVLELPLLSKAEVAARILDEVSALTRRDSDES